MTKILYNTLLYFSLLCFILTVVALALGYGATVLGPLITTMFVSLAIGVRGTKTIFESFAFSLWIFASVSFAMFYPQYMTSWGGYKLNSVSKKTLHF